MNELNLNESTSISRIVKVIFRKRQLVELLPCRDLAMLLRGENRRYLNQREKLLPKFEYSSEFFVLVDVFVVGYKGRMNA
jgi:hypothetical protein